MSTIATAYVQVLPSTKGMKSALGNELNGIGNEAGENLGNNISSSALSKFKNLGTFVAVGTAIGAAVVKGVSSAVSEGAGLEQAIGGIETLFKDSADKVIQNANNAFATSGLSAREYMENVTSFSASLLQSLSGDTKRAAEIADMALVDMSDNANKMGTDMAAIQNAYQGFAKQNYTMLDNLKLGYGGTKQEMQRLLKDAQELSGVRYDISNLSDVYSAIHEIQKELGITGTTAEEAMSTVSGSFNMLKSSIKNVLGGLTGEINLTQALEGLGASFSAFFNDNLIPMIKEVFANFPKIIEQLFSEGFIQGISETVANIGSLVGDIATAIIEGLADLLILAPVIGLAFVKGLIEALPDILNSLSSMFQSLAQNLPEMAKFFVKEMPKLMGEIVLALIDCIPQILVAVAEIGVAIVEALVRTIAEGLMELPAVFAELGSMFAPLGEQISSGLTNAMQNIGSAISPVISEIDTMFGGLGTSLAEMFQSMAGTAQSAANLIATAFSPLVQSIGSIFAEAIEAMKSQFAGIESFFADVVRKIAGAFESVIEQFRQLGLRIVQALKEGITSAWNNLVNAIKQRIQQITELFNGLTRHIDNVTNHINGSMSSATSNAQRLSSSVQSTQSAVRGMSYSSQSTVVQSSPQVNVMLNGSARSLFDVVRVENNKFSTATGYSAF